MYYEFVHIVDKKHIFINYVEIMIGIILMKNQDMLHVHMKAFAIILIEKRSNIKRLFLMHFDILLESVLWERMFLNLK